MSSIRVAGNQGQVVVFAPERIDLDRGSRTFSEIVRSLLAGGFQNIIVDMSATNYVDSSGIGELVIGYTSTRNRGGSLLLNRVPKKPRDLLDITHLSSIFQISERNFDDLPWIDVRSDDVSSLRAAETLPLLLSLRENHISVELGIQDGVLKVRAGDGQNERTSVIVAAPHVLSTGAGTLMFDTVKEFEELIDSPRTNENDIQRFLEENPSFLLGREYRQLHPKVLLERYDDGPLVPDFALQPFDQELCDLLELKLPCDPLIVGTKNRQRLSAAVHTAVAQLRTYRDYFEDRANRERIFRRYGIKAFRPRLSVVIGRVPKVDAIEYRKIIDGQTSVRIVTYDDLLARAKRFLIV